MKYINKSLNCPCSGQIVYHVSQSCGHVWDMRSERLLALLWNRRSAVLRERSKSCVFQTDRSHLCVQSVLQIGKCSFKAGMLTVWSEAADGLGCCVCCCLYVAQLLPGHSISSQWVWFHSGIFTFSFPGLSRTLLAGSQSGVCWLLSRMATWCNKCSCSHSSC